MIYDVLIPSLYRDVCITCATLSVSYFALSNKAPFSYQSEWWRRVLFGIFAGVAMIVLSQHRQFFSASIYYSFAALPMILVVFFGGGLSGLVAFLLCAAFTGGLTVDNLFTAFILTLLLLTQVWLKRSNRVFYTTIGLIALYRIAVVSNEVDVAVQWLDILLYQAVSLLFLAVCYHALSFKERYIQTFFAMRDKATLDSLTHINNRASVDYKMMLQHAQRKPCGMLIIDLDNFKTVNDTYGHVSGDMLLASVARLLQDGVRNEDFVGRYGGEEFIVITASHDPKVVNAVAERIRQDVQDTLFIVAEGEEICITLSIGASLYLPGMGIDKAVEIADEALYRAKHAGKNNVACSRLMQLSELVS